MPLALFAFFRGVTVAPGAIDAAVLNHRVKTNPAAFPGTLEFQQRPDSLCRLGQQTDAMGMIHAAETSFPRACRTLHTRAGTIWLDPVRIAAGPDIVPVEKHQPFAGQRIRLPLNDPSSRNPLDDFALLRGVLGGRLLSRNEEQTQQDREQSGLQTSPATATYEPGEFDALLWFSALQREELPRRSGPDHGNASKKNENRV